MKIEGYTNLDDLAIGWLAKENKLILKIRIIICVESVS